MPLIIIQTLFKSSRMSLLYPLRKHKSTQASIKDPYKIIYRA